MTRECFIKEGGIRYSEIDGGKMESDSVGPCCVLGPGVIEEYAEKYPYLLKSEEFAFPALQNRVIDGKLYFLLHYVQRGGSSIPDRIKETVYKSENPVKRWPLDREKEIGYWWKPVWEEPNSYLLYWHPLTKEILHD